MFTGHYEEGLMDTILAEAVAERNEALLEAYLDEGYKPETWQSALGQMFKKAEVFPVFAGSALNLSLIHISPFKSSFVLCVLFYNSGFFIFYEKWLTK